MSESKFCEQCGAPLTPDMRFCEACGTPVFKVSSPSATATGQPVPSAQPPAQPTAPIVSESIPSPQAVIPYVEHEMGSFLSAADCMGNLIVMPDAIIFAVAPPRLAEEMAEESVALQREFKVRFKSGSAWRAHLERLEWGAASWRRYETMPVDQIARENSKNMILPRSSIRAISVCVHEDESEIFDAILIEQAPKKEVWFKLHNGNGYLAGKAFQRFYGGLVTVERGTNDE